ncbi:MAG: enoyl-CoA hydratase/isomerase family protein, partial [Acidimicrobiales bacterium]|nr:enoyl-CoA hydratase/isomerase family protein [Acidimicrobiales bacterium]
MSEYLSLEQHGHVSVLTLDNGENRWTTTMTRELDAALDEVEQTTGPHALVTASSDPKFFSNGLDLDWITSKGDHEGGDRRVFGDEAMKLFARLITFPMPTIAAVNGHAFGAGFMWALCHDQRVMRRDRGMMCANEIEIGVPIPEAELALFHHKLPRHAFYETVQFAKRWTGEEAFSSGFVQELADQDEVTSKAIERAEELSRLGANRELFKWQKE